MSFTKWLFGNKLLVNAYYDCWLMSVSKYSYSQSSFLPLYNYVEPYKEYKPGKSSAGL